MKTKILFCLMALVALTATAHSQLEPALGLHARINPHNIIMSEQTLKSDVAVTSTACANLVRTAKSTHQVNFMLDFDTNTQIATDILLVNNNGKIDQWGLGLWQFNNGSNIAFVPNGTYDIIVTFVELENKGTNYGNLHHYLHVIREQVIVDQDMELDFSAAEANNHIHFQTLTINGEPVNTGVYSMDSNWQLTPIEQGNTADVIYQTKILCKDYGEIKHDSNNFGVNVEVGDYHISNYEYLADVYVNDVSDRYAFGSYRVAIDLDYNMYTSYKEVQGASGNLVIANDPSKFKLYENQFTLSQHQNEDIYHAFELHLKKEGEIYTNIYRNILGWPIADKDIFKYFISASADESEVGYIPYIQPEACVKQKMVDDEGYEYEAFKPFIVTMPITNTNETIIFANSGIGNYGFYGIGQFSYEWDETEQVIKQYPIWPPHPIFTYSVDKKKGLLGNNSPMLITNPMQYESFFTWEDEEGNPITFSGISNYFYYQYLGRHGEIALDFRNNAQVILNLDGENFYNGLGYIVDNDSEHPLQFDEMFNGVVDATITTSPFKVDDLDGSNRAQLHYTAGAEDETPPTMTMMHFKDNNGDVTDRFATVEDGMVEFSAADFNFAMFDDWTYFRYAPETVEVSYSPYGEDNWNELAVEELSEYYYPAMGWFYRGSLAGVTGEALKGWFDLKVKLTDAAGNWQEQIISPAFRIDDLAYTSVANIGCDNAHEVARYSLDGKRVDADATGIVIVKMSDGTARKILVK